MHRHAFARAGALLFGLLLPASVLAQPRTSPPPSAAAPAPTAADVPPTPPPIDVKDPLLEPIPAPVKMLSGWRDALTLIASRSTDIAIATQEIARAEGLTRQALGAALPQIDAKGTFTYDLIRGQQQTFGGFSPTGASEVPPTPTATATLTVVQPVFAPRAWYAIGTARRGVEVNKLELGNKRRTIVLAVANAIVGVVTAERVSEVNRNGLQASLALLELTRRKQLAGTGTRLDLLRTQQDATVARATLIAGDEALREAREALGLALGFSEAYGVPPNISLDDLEQSARSTCTSGTIEERPDVLAAKANLEVADRQVNDAKLAFSPTLSAVSLMTASNQTLANDKNYAWSIQALLTIPIFDGGSRYGVLRQNKANAEEIKATLAGTERGAKLEAAQALRAVGVAEAARATSAEGRDLARETARLARIAFEAGTGTSFDLVDSAKKQRDAELDLAVKEFDVVKAKIAALLATARCDY